MLDPSEVPQEARRRLLEEAWRLGLKPRDLGVSYSFMYQMRKGAKPIPDHVVARVLEFLDDDAILRAAPELAPKLGIQRVDTITLERLIRLNIEFMRRNPVSARILVDTLNVEAERLGLVGRVVKVTEDHVRLWERWLEAQVEQGRLTPKTAGDYDRYLRRALRDLGFIVGPQRVRAYLSRLQIEAPKIAENAALSLRIFARYILGDQEVYFAAKVPRAPRRRREAPTWEELCRLLEALKWPPARAFLLLLMSTGSRTGRLLAVEAERLDLERRTLFFYYPEEWYKLRDANKRQYIGFITRAAREYIESVYLPWRELYLESLAVKSPRLFPVKRSRLYQYIYERSVETLGYRIDLYSVRHRFISHILTRLPKLAVEFLAGHLEPSTALAYYAQEDVREDLRRKYDEAMSSVPCLGGGRP